MIAKRIIPCLDVKDNQVVKGVQFKNHRVVGQIEELAIRYAEQGADELVFYDITASCEARTLDKTWISRIASVLDIPFCVAGGIRTIEDAKKALANGADKISINSPALENPSLINQLATEFGSQCIVVGIDSLYKEDDYYVCQYTGKEDMSRTLNVKTTDWLYEVQDRGAGEIVLNCMNNDGVRKGYDVEQLKKMRPLTYVPLIASGGAGHMADFDHVFAKAKVDAALAASVFHENKIEIPTLKRYLSQQGFIVRC